MRRRRDRTGCASPTGNRDGWPWCSWHEIQGHLRFGGGLAHELACQLRDHGNGRRGQVEVEGQLRFSGSLALPVTAKLSSIAIRATERHSTLHIARSHRPGLGWRRWRRRRWRLGRRWRWVRHASVVSVRWRRTWRRGLFCLFALERLIIQCIPVPGQLVHSRLAGAHRVEEVVTTYFACRAGRRQSRPEIPLSRIRRRSVHFHGGSRKATAKLLLAGKLRGTRAERRDEERERCVTLWQVVAIETIDASAPSDQTAYSYPTRWRAGPCHRQGSQICRSGWRRGPAYSETL